MFVSLENLGVLEPLPVVDTLLPGHHWSVELSPRFTAPEITALADALAKDGFPVEVAVGAGNRYLLRAVNPETVYPTGQFLIFIMTQPEALARKA